MVRLSNTKLSPTLIVLPRLLMSLGLMEHLYVEDLVTAVVEVAEMVVMVATVIAMDTVMETMAIKVDTLEATVIAVEEVVEDAVVFSVTSLVPLIGIVPKVKGAAAEVVDTPMVVVVVVVSTLC
ncbi:hypothetical protein H5410_007752 [Solanum commersonii]|uniref:Uncharacterized protein n=1 Tax=Solanum commersonii TaxID=4109 RepID=A0A9J6ACY4_SOLCO|nr:hypothetical protein H5410_007752 [Solanum commersonii]